MTAPGMNWAKAALGIGAIYGGLWWFPKKSYDANVNLWKGKFENHEAVDVMYPYTMDSYGHDSGNSTLDHWAYQAKWLPTIWMADYHRAATYVNGFVNDVVIKNAIPLAIGAAGLYGALGAHLFAPIRWIRAITPAGFWSTIGGGIGTAAKGIGSGLLSGLGWAARQAVNGGWGTVGLGGIAAYFGYRFWRTYTHQEQHDRYLPFVTGMDAHH